MAAANAPANAPPRATIERVATAPRCTVATLAAHTEDLLNTVSSARNRCKQLTSENGPGPLNNSMRL